MKIKIELIDKIKENSMTCDKVILSDVYRDYTLSDVDELSSQVYAYLSEHHISTEDVVMINIRRSAMVFICLLGIFKAGACGVIVADWTGDDFFEFFRNDSRPKLIITDDVLSDMLETHAKPGCELPDVHDAAVICYTSSSTGMPKGAVHEYGELNLVARYSQKELENFDLSIVRYLNTPYLYDIGSIQAFLVYVYCNAFIRIPERDLNMVWNSEKLIEEANRYQINITNVMPRFFDTRLFREMKYLKLLEVSYTTVESIYDDMIFCCNSYGTSESMVPLTHSFMIDKAYDITPVGTSLEVLPLYIVDENDQVLKPGEIGEIVFENPFFRGYLNMPQETEKALRNGLYHTGDIGMFRKDGNLIVLDRKINTVQTDRGLIISNMIKIRLKKIWTGRFVYVVSRKCKRPEGQGDAVKIVVFYTGNEDIEHEDIESARRYLAEELPDYMQPTDFVRLDAVPYLTSGKLNLQVLIERADELLVEK